MKGSNRQDAKIAKKEKKRLRRLRREVKKEMYGSFSRTRRWGRFALGLVGIALDLAPIGEPARRATRAALGGVKTAKERHRGTK